MSVSLFTTSTFFKYFIYRPDSAHLTESERRVATIASWAFFVCTLGVLPSACKKIWNQCTIWNSEQKQVIMQRLKDSIKNLSYTSIDPQQINPSMDIACNQIYHGLYLGNSEAFVDATHLRFNHSDRQGRIIIKETSNHRRFERIITVCPMLCVTEDFCDLLNLKSDAISLSFSRHNIQWINVGRTAADCPKEWEPLVHDCTHLDSEEARFELDPKRGLEITEMQSLANTKTNKIRAIRVSEWFAPVFEQIDEAVFNERRVLVHSQHGISRSALILAAYLIHRCHATSEEAINFLRSKRPCVDPKFTEQLDKYQNNIF